MILDRTAFSEAQRAQFEALQAHVKPALLHQEPVIAVWALMDLAYFVAQLPRMGHNRALVAAALRRIAAVIEPT